MLQFIQSLRTAPDVGYPLRDEWDGYRAQHVYRDTYRVIWKVDDAAVVVHRVGTRFPTGTAGIYAEPPD